MIFIGLLGIFPNERRKWNRMPLISVDDIGYKVLFLFSLLLLLNMVGIFKADNPFSSIVGEILSPRNVLILSFVILTIYSQPRLTKNLEKNFVVFSLLVFSVIGYIIFQMLNGSRSGMLAAIQLMLFASLACGVYRVKKKVLAFAAVLIMLSIVSFTVTTYMRAINFGQKKIDYAKTFEEGYKYAGKMNFDFDNSLKLLVPVFDRIAYLDFTVDMLKNSDEYRPVINVPSGLASIVDGMTPGFDLFNAPKLANALSGVYRYDSAIFLRSHDRAYQSDQFNVYGEYYVLFQGWVAMPVFALVAFLFKRVYLNLPSRTFFEQKVWQTFVLATYASWLISFGFDWIIIYTTMGGLSLWLIMFAMKTKFLWRTTST
jgi:hypothetical protein